MEDTNKVTSHGLLMVTGFAHISKEINELKTMVEKKVAYIKCEKAIESYNQHIGKKLKQPRHHKFLLKSFLSVFGEKNIADITAVEIESFLVSRWSGNTFNAQRSKLSGFFSYCIKEQQRQNAPVFVNPTTLIENNKEILKEFKYRPALDIKWLINTASTKRQWLWLTLLASSGVRCREMLKLRPADIKGRVLTLWYPKSGKEKEFAVIPEIVANELKKYTKKINADGLIWAGNYNTQYSKVYEMMTTKKRTITFRYTPHDLRHFLATFYDRKNQIAMRRGILRHSIGPNMTNLEARYVAPYSLKEMMDCQDKYLVPELF